MILKLYSIEIRQLVSDRNLCLSVTFEMID